VSEYLDIADARVRPISPTIIEIDLTPRADTALLKDHFKGHPIVPGVIQLRWIFEFAKAHLDSHLPKTSYTIRNLKFSAPMIPNTDYLLRIESVGARLAFRTTSGSGNATKPVASGVIEFDS
jgi:3-hydroxymyristoyl/3-hydroxydecanoyl-(acyl carrier protein) dehydratase